MIQQTTPFNFSPADGRPWRLGVRTAAEYRVKNPAVKRWRANPWTGEGRSEGDVASDPLGLLIIPPGEELVAASKRERDPDGIDQHAPGAKLDAGKMLPWLMIRGFAHALNAVADVTTKGARKYTPDGWAKVANGEDRYMEAFGRHLLALARGEQLDPDTECMHKAQMIWNLLASLELELRELNNW